MYHGAAAATALSSPKFTHNDTILSVSILVLAVSLSILIGTEREEPRLIVARPFVPITIGQDRSPSKNCANKVGRSEFWDRCKI